MINSFDFHIHHYFLSKQKEIVYAILYPKKLIILLDGVDQCELNNRAKKLESTEKNFERKKETRRKILIGSYYLDQARKNNTFSELKNIMTPYLSRDNDKKLFD